MNVMRFSLSCLIAVTCLSGCVAIPNPFASAPAEPVTMRWAHVDGHRDWEAASFAALDSHAAILPTLVPDDIDEWCPGYARNDLEERRQFWVGLMSSLAYHESTWNPDVVGGGNRWFGLVQIYPSTARFRGCEATTAAELQDGAANMSCAFRIWAFTVPRDNVVSEGNRGVAADWGPMHSSQSHKREDIRNWVSAQPFCTR